VLLEISSQIIFAIPAESRDSPFPLLFSTRGNPTFSPFPARSIMGRTHFSSPTLPFPPIRVSPHSFFFVPVALKEIKVFLPISLPRLTAASPAPILLWTHGHVALIFYPSSPVFVPLHFNFEPNKIKESETTLPNNSDVILPSPLSFFLHSFPPMHSKVLSTIFASYSPLVRTRFVRDCTQPFYPNCQVPLPPFPSFPLYAFPPTLRRFVHLERKLLACTPLPLPPE